MIKNLVIYDTGPGSEIRSPLLSQKDNDFHDGERENLEFRPPEVEIRHAKGPIKRPKFGD